jgi:membrane protease subunit (stomatin/prohibitin family)
MGMATGGMGLGGLQQPTAPQGAPQGQQPPAAEPAAAPAEPAAEDPMAMLKRAKDMLDAGLINQEDYDAVKAKALGL